MHLEPPARGGSASRPFVKQPAELQANDAPQFRCEYGLTSEQVELHLFGAGGLGLRESGRD
jgi:hypothetical protein